MHSKEYNALSTATSVHSRPMKTSYPPCVTVICSVHDRLSFWTSTRPMTFHVPPSPSSTRLNTRSSSSRPERKRRGRPAAPKRATGRELKSGRRTISETTGGDPVEDIRSLARATRRDATRRGRLRILTRCGVPSLHSGGGGMDRTYAG